MANLRHTTGFFLKHPGVQLTLYLRRAYRLKNPDPSRVTIVEGDVLDVETLKGAMRGQDVVYANLAGAMAQQAKTIVNAMHATGLKRLMFQSRARFLSRSCTDVHFGQDKLVVFQLEAVGGRKLAGATTAGVPQT
jgi:hypothetical protein